MRITQTINERQNLKGKRFGNIPKEILTPLNSLPKIYFPNLHQVHQVKGNDLAYKRINNYEEMAERIAEIYRNGIDEQAGIPHYEFHHDPKQIVERCNTGDWAFYGIFKEETLISVLSMFINRGMHYLQWVWGAVDPEYRGNGVWKHLGHFADKVCELSGATYGRVWAATFHDLTLRTCESTGYSANSVELELLGGSDGLCYFQPVVFYMKTYKQEHILKKKDLVLTKEARAMIDSCPQFI